MQKSKTNNFNLIQKSQNCGCAHCFRIYPAKEIVEWIETDSEETAICPYCGTDYVLPDSVNDINTIIPKLKYDHEKHKR